jgi:hypothetical protein
MNTPTPESPLHVKPKPDDLAGTPVCQEENNPTIHVRRGVRAGNALSTQPTPVPPTADDLAGIPVSAEGKEDLSIRPRQPRQQK